MHMNRTFLWEAKRLAHDWASDYMDAQEVPDSVSADEFVEPAFSGGKTNGTVKRVAAQFRNQAYERAVRFWTASYREQRKLRSVTVDELLALAGQQRGTNPGITKTKLRKAASRIVAGAFSRASLA